MKLPSPKIFVLLVLIDISSYHPKKLYQCLYLTNCMFSPDKKAFACNTKVIIVPTLT